jgi:hypothetical protein
MRLMPQRAGEVRVAHTGDVHLEEDRYFGDTAQCLEWFVCDGIRAGVDLFVINGDLTTYKATIKERNLWIDTLIRMADHAPVIVTAGNHGRELSGDLYVYSRAKGKNPIMLCTEPGSARQASKRFSPSRSPSSAANLLGGQIDTNCSLGILVWPERR